MPPWTWSARAGDVDRGVGRVGLRAVGGHERGLGVVVERPGGPVGDRARALGLEEHLRAGVRDGLVGADRAAELLALLGVVDGRAASPARRRRRTRPRPSPRSRARRGRSRRSSSSPGAPSKRTVNSGRVASSARAGSIVASAAGDREVPAALGGDDERVGDVGVGHGDLHAGQRAVLRRQRRRLRVGGAVVVPHRDRAAALELPGAAASPPSARPAASARARSRAPRRRPRARRSRTRRCPASRARRSRPSADRAAPSSAIARIFSGV